MKGFGVGRLKVVPSVAVSHFSRFHVANDKRTDGRSSNNFIIAPAAAAKRVSRTDADDLEQASNHPRLELEQKTGHLGMEGGRQSGTLPESRSPQ